MISDGGELVSKPQKEAHLGYPLAVPCPVVPLEGQLVSNANSCVGQCLGMLAIL